MTAKDPQCKAKGHGCGTPSGWRYGGRCTECRRAHNEETRELRRRKAAPSEDQVSALLILMSQGADLTEAARRVGMSPQTARTVAAADVRFMSVDGYATTKATRQATYLGLLFRHHGEPTRTAEAAGISPVVLLEWRTEDLFKAAEDAARAFCVSRVPNPRRTMLTDEKLERVVGLVAAGHTLKDAANEAGVTPGAVYQLTARDPEFRRQLSELRPDGWRHGGRKRVDERQLRELWASDLTLAQITEALGVSPPTLRKWAIAFGLGARSRRR